MYCTHLYVAVGSGIVLQYIAVDHEPIAYAETQEEPVVPPLEGVRFGADKVDGTYIHKMRRKKGRGGHERERHEQKKGKEG